MKAKTLSVCAAVAVILACGVSPAVAVPVLSFDEATGSSGANNNQNVGWQFDVLVATGVIGVGWFDERADGLGRSHEVGIWNSAGTLLTSAVIPSGVGAALDGQFRTVAVTPLVLSVGNGYIVGGLNFSNSGDRLAANVVHIVNPNLRYIDATFSPFTAIFGRPTNFSVATTGFYGPSFSVREVVPEPATLLLFGTGLAAVGVRRSRLKK